MFETLFIQPSRALGQTLGHREIAVSRGRVLLKPGSFGFHSTLLLPSTIVPVLRLRLLILFRPLLLLKEQESKALDDWLLSSVPPSKLSTGRAFASYSIADLNAHVSRFWLKPGCHQPSVFVLRVAGTERSRSGTCHLRVSTRLFIEYTRAS